MPILSDTGIRRLPTHRDFAAISNTHIVCQIAPGRWRPPCNVDSGVLCPQKASGRQKRTVNRTLQYLLDGFADRTKPFR